MDNFNHKFIFNFGILIVILGILLVPKAFGLKHALASSVCNIGNCGDCDSTLSCADSGCSWDGSGKVCVEPALATPPVFPFCAPARIDSDGEGKFVYTTDCYGDWDGGSGNTHIRQTFTADPEYACTAISKPTFEPVDCADVSPLVEVQNKNLLISLFKKIIKDIFNFAKASSPGKCYQPIFSNCHLTYPWQIYHAEAYTVSTSDVNDINRCNLATVLWDKNKHEVPSRGESRDITCGSLLGSAVSSIYVMNDSLPSASVRLDVTLDGGWFNAASWKGYVKYWAKRVLFKDFSADKTIITPGQPVTLHWDIVNAAKKSNGQPRIFLLVGGGFKYCLSGPCDPDAGGYELDLPTDSGSITVYPEKTTNFTLSAYGPSGEGLLWFMKRIDITVADLTADIKVRKAGVGSYGDGPITVSSGSGVDLQWTSHDADSCAASAIPDNPQWAGTIATSGTKTISNLTQYAVFAIDCSGAGTTTNDQVSVNVTDLKADIKARKDAESPWSDDPIVVASGHSAEVQWTSNDADSCTASTIPSNPQWTGTIATSGTKTISNLAKSTAFTISCSGTDATINDYVSVNINGAGTSHLVCQNQSCVMAAGSGSDECSGDSDCSTNSTHLVCQNNACVAVAGDGNNECAVDTDCQQKSTGIITVKATLDGQEVSAPGLIYQLTGPSSFSGTSVPKIFNNAAEGTYTLIYISGAPNGGLPPPTVRVSSLPVVSGQTTTFYLDFGSPKTCNIDVKAACGANDYTGTVAFRLMGPNSFDGTYATYSFTNIPVGLYYLGYVAGGPGTLQSVSPVNPLYCFPGQTAPITMNFKDCGLSHAECKNNQCVSVSGPGSNQCSTDNDCAGTCDTSTPVKAGILCWGNKSSDPSPCIGRIDPKNPDSPSLILYNNSKGSKCVESCLWQVFDANTGQWKQDQKSCAPLPWYEQLGRYRAVLKLTDKQGRSDSVERDFNVIDIDTLACDFAWDPDSPKALSLANFFDRSQTPRNTTVKTWNWTFEDAAPASSKLQNPTGVLFNTIGEKTIQLTVTNSAGQQDTCSQKIQVRKLIPHWKEIIP